MVRIPKKGEKKRKKKEKKKILQMTEHEQQSIGSEPVGHHIQHRSKLARLAQQASCVSIGCIQQKRRCVKAKENDGLTQRVPERRHKQSHASKSNQIRNKEKNVNKRNSFLGHSIQNQPSLSNYVLLPNY
jgi:hypothetical protein